MASTLGANADALLAGAQLPFAMAEDGLFFRAAAGLSLMALGVPAYAWWRRA